MRDGGPAHTYRVPEPARCYGCDTKIKAQDKHAEKRTVREQALLWVVERDR